MPRSSAPCTRPRVDATEEAIINALFAAETMVGRDGITADALPIESVVDLMATGRRNP